MSLKCRNPNDFGTNHPLLYVYGRGAVEDRIAIRITDVTSTEEWKERDIEELSIFKKKFKINNIEMELIKDQHFCDWYIELSKPGPKCSCTAISLTATRCCYGGYRYWFVCPDIDCQKRVGVLYKDGDDFRCRKCLDLDYSSHEVNYKSIEPALRYLSEFKEMDIPNRRTYKRKDTKKMARFFKLKEKASGGFDFYGKKYLK